MLSCATQVLGPCWYNSVLGRDPVTKQPLVQLPDSMREEVAFGHITCAEWFLRYHCHRNHSSRIVFEEKVLQSLNNIVLPARFQQLETHGSIPAVATQLSGGEDQCKHVHRHVISCLVPLSLMLGVCDSSIVAVPSPNIPGAKPRKFLAASGGPYFCGDEMTICDLSMSCGRVRTRFFIR